MKSVLWFVLWFVLFSLAAVFLGLAMVRLCYEVLGAIRGF